MLGEAADLYLDTLAPHLDAEMRGLVRESAIDELVGLGPLDVLTSDPFATAFYVRAHDDVSVVRKGVERRTNTTFRDADHLRAFVERICPDSAQSHTEPRDEVSVTWGDWRLVFRWEGETPTLRASRGDAEPMEGP